MTTETLAEHRSLPWNALVTGSVDHEEKSGLEVLKKAGLDFDVSVRPLWRKMSNGEFVQHPRDRETYRTDTEQTLGTVRGRYKVFPNREAFEFGDEIVKGGDASWVNAGQRGNGRQVFMTLQLSEGFTVGGEDAYQLYLLLRTNHDGTGKVNVDVVPFRMFCLNQAQLVLSTSRANWGASHTADVASKVKEAKEALDLTGKYAVDLKAHLEKLMTMKLTESHVDAILNEIVDEKRHRRQDIIDGIKLNYLTSLTVDPHRGTAYGLLNGLTEWFDHHKEQRTADARFSSVMSGEGAKTRNRLIMTLAA